MVGQINPATRFAAIWSNPPVRIGKTALHQMLGTWSAYTPPHHPRRGYLVSTAEQRRAELAAGREELARGEAIVMETAAWLRENITPIKAPPSAATP